MLSKKPISKGSMQLFKWALRSAVIASVPKAKTISKIDLKLLPEKAAFISVSDESGVILEDRKVEDKDRAKLEKMVKPIKMGYKEFAKIELIEVNISYSDNSETPISICGYDSNELPIKKIILV